MKKRFIYFGSFFLVALIVLVVFCVLIHQNGGYPLGMDAWARDLAYNTRGEKGNFCYIFFRCLTEFGDIYFIAVLAVAALIYTKFDNRFLIFAIGVVLQAVLNAVFKEIYQRPRPDSSMWWMTETSTSFPSGHSTSAGFLYPFLIYIFATGNEKKQIKITAIAISAAFIAIIPVSRIIIGVHYLSDVIAGLMLGGMTSILCMFVLELLKYYNILPEGIIHLKFIKKKKENKEEK